MSDEERPAESMAFLLVICSIQDELEKFFREYGQQKAADHFVALAKAICDEWHIVPKHRVREFACELAGVIAVLNYDESKERN